MKKNLIIIILLTICSVSAQTTDDKETLKQLNQKINSSYQDQKFDDALKFARQALDLTLKVFGAEDLRTADSYSALGAIYREKKKYKESIENLQKALEIHQTQIGANRIELAKIYKTLASVYFSNDKGKEAEANYLKALEVSETIFGKDSKESVPFASALAIFYARINNVEKSNEYFLKSYVLLIKYFGKDSNELETLRINEEYYSRQDELQSDTEQYKEYKKKKSAILGYEAGNAISLIKPASPVRTKLGRLVVKIWIDEQGNVTNAKAVYGTMAFASDCEEAARKSKFTPSLMKGKPISVIDFITYNFGI